MPNNDPVEPVYVKHEERLAQGNIFVTDLVTPRADSCARIFRTADGRHGSAVFSEQTESQVFSVKDLENLLASSTSSDPLKTKPFVATTDGHPEMVVAYAERSTMFVIASQTCDVCGVDRKVDLVAILPAYSLKSRCVSVKLPYESKEFTIHELVLRETNHAELNEASDVDYAGELRRALDKWPSGSSKTLKEKIVNVAGKNAGHLYHLGADATLGIPAMTIDLSVMYTIPLSLLESLKGSRLATIASPSREHFSEALANRFKRVALQKPHQLF